MPRHDWECGACGGVEERFVLVADLDKAATCKCGGSMTRVFLKAPRGFVTAPVHYRCPITDKPVTSREAHRENLARHKCRVLEPGERADAQRRKAAADNALERRVDATAEEFVERLPGDKRQQLANEISAGVTAEIVRN